MAETTRNSDQVLNATRARQGRFGRPVLWVLLASTLLAALALFAAWTWRAPQLAAQPTVTGHAQAAATYAAPAPSQTVRQTSQPGEPSHGDTP